MEQKLGDGMNAFERQFEMFAKFSRHDPPSQTQPFGDEKTKNSLRAHYRSEIHSYANPDTKILETQN